MIRVTCSECEKSFNVADEKAGKKMRCKCRAVIAVPASEQVEPDVPAEPEEADEWKPGSAYDLAPMAEPPPALNVRYEDEDDDGKKKKKKKGRGGGDDDDKSIGRLIFLLVILLVLGAVAIFVLMPTE